MFYSYQLNSTMLINSLSLDTPAAIHFLQQLNCNHNYQHLIVGSLPPYEGFEDFGLGLNQQTYFRTQILALFL